jgi:hypothetical protein
MTGCKLGEQAGGVQRPTVDPDGGAGHAATAVHLTGPLE